MCAKIELSLLRTEIHPSFTSAVIFPIFYGSGNQNKTNKQGFQTTTHNSKKMPTFCKKTSTNSKKTVMEKNPPLLFKAVGQAGTYPAWPTVYKPTSSSSPIVRSVVNAKISKQAIYFCLSNRARIWAFFGKPAHKATRPQNSILGHHHGYSPELVQAAAKCPQAGPAIIHGQAKITQNFHNCQIVLFHADYD